jgi:hypothetical protein
MFPVAGNGFTHPDMSSRPVAMLHHSVSVRLEVAPCPSFTSVASESDQPSCTAQLTQDPPNRIAAIRSLQANPLNSGEKVGARNH